MIGRWPKCWPNRAKSTDATTSVVATVISIKVSRERERERRGAINFYVYLTFAFSPNFNWRTAKRYWPK